MVSQNAIAEQYKAVQVWDVIDGDTFKDEAGQRYRIWGIDAPEIDTSGGEESRWALIHALRFSNGLLSCKEVYTDKYQRKVVKCLQSWEIEGHTSHSIDIAEALAYMGQAKDSPKYSGRLYSPETKAAKANCLGIHKKSCE